MRRRMFAVQQVVWECRFNQTDGHFEMWYVDVSPIYGSLTVTTDL